MYEAIGGAVSAFSNAAAAGQVSIEADAAADALEKMGKVKDELTELLSLHGHGGSGTEVQLGANPVGQAMAQKSMDRYNGGDSFLTALKLLADQTAKAETALRQCIDNYVDQEDLQTATYNRTQS